MKKFCLIAIVASATFLDAQSPASRMVEWPYYGGQQAHTKYSPADDLTPANVSQLAPAWQWTPNHYAVDGGTRPGLFENTPLMIDNVLYASTSNNRVVALDAESGKELWSFDPKVAGDPGGAGTHRGVAYWRDGDDARIFMNSRHRLFSVNAKTGQLVTSFGLDGYTALNEGLRQPIEKRLMDQTSPPVVYKNLVIVGSSINDRLIVKGDPVGTVQAFDARTGKRAWVFYTVPWPKEFGNNTWEMDSWAITGHANVWGIMSLDEARGLLYVPTSTPSGDFYGGRRPGANLFAESLLCLDANTGERKWHFQGVHHGLWDYDFSSAPTLLTIAANGRRIDAVAQSGKQGFTYVFDRVTGEPVWPIEERAVATDSDVPGEVVYPTQPFPTRPAAFAPQGISLADANDLTPEIHALAVEEMQQFRLGPLFTPPSLRGTLQRPSAGGGANWGSSGADPETGILYLKVSEHTSLNQVCKQGSTDPMAFLGVISDIEFNTNGCAHNTAGNGPFAVPRQPRKLGAVPVVKPPYAEVVALDLNKGEILWRTTLGEGQPSIRQSPLLKGVTLPDRLGTHGNTGGVTVTKGGLVFAGMAEPHLYAFDKVTGREISRVRTPFAVNGAPMTYRARNGRQFVVVATGGGPDAVLSAYALPTTGGAPVTTAARAQAPGAGAAPKDASGKDAFDRICAACHGPEARGDAGPRLVPFGGSLDALRAVVREGSGQMPPVSARELSDDSVALIHDYLVSLSR